MCRHFFLTIPEFYIIWRQPTLISMCYIFAKLDIFLEHAVHQVYWYRYRLIYFLHIILEHTVHLEDHKTRHLTTFIESIWCADIFLLQFPNSISYEDNRHIYPCAISLLNWTYFWNMQYIKSIDTDTDWYIFYHQSGTYSTSRKPKN